LAEELSAPRLTGGELHDTYPEDDDGRGIVYDDFGIVRRPSHPEVRLDLSYSQGAAIEAVEKRLYVFSGDHR
jgi:hypothetical protein